MANTKVRCVFSNHQRTASRKALGVGWSCSQSAGRAGTGVFSTGMCADPRCTLHNHRDAQFHTSPTPAHYQHFQHCFALFYHSHLCLLSHSTLRAAAAFHQNFTPILTITQLVSVRSNHSESGNHDRLLLIKLLRVRCKLDEREV